MYLLSLLLGVILIIMLANKDKDKSFEINEPTTMWHIKECDIDIAWFEYFEGRKKFYKILVVLCFIPYLYVGFGIAITVCIGIIIFYFTKLINKFI